MHAGKVQPVFAVAWILLFTVYPLSKVNRPYQVVHQPQRETVLAYIQANTKPGDEVLVWGGEPVINFLSGREMPLRFVFMSQPFLAGYATERFAGEILTELKAHPPAIIIDSRNCAIPFLDYETYACVPVPGQWTQVYDYIRRSYRLTTHLGSANWGIYTYTQ